MAVTAGLPVYIPGMLWTVIAIISSNILFQLVFCEVDMSSFITSFCSSLGINPPPPAGFLRWGAVLLSDLVKPVHNKKEK